MLKMSNSKKTAGFAKTHEVNLLMSCKLLAPCPMDSYVLDLNAFIPVKDQMIKNFENSECSKVMKKLNPYDR